jgi:GPN-loop GTPase
MDFEFERISAGEFTYGCVCAFLIGRRYLDPDPLLLAPADNEAQERHLNKRFHSLNRAIVQLVSVVNSAITNAKLSQIEENPLVSFLPLDLTTTDSIERIISHIDYIMQYGEDEEPKEASIRNGF